MKAVLLWPLKLVLKIFIWLNVIMLISIACFWAFMNLAVGISCSLIDVVVSAYACLLAGVFLLFCT